MGSLQKIDHIVVLMLENRSFDSLLGTLYPKSDSFEGLNGTEQNPDANGTPVVVWNNPGTDETTMRIPNPDPGELWTDINMQLFGNSAPAPGQRPTMAGFVQNYLAQRQLNLQQTYDPKSVMHYFAPAQVPVLSQLAQKFAVCDHWFASAPCQTWPNRWFVHAATADGHENNDPPHSPGRVSIRIPPRQQHPADDKQRFDQRDRSTPLPVRHQAPSSGADTPHRLATVDIPARFRKSACAVSRRRSPASLLRQEH
jgi:phospholipase C